MINRGKINTIFCCSIILLISYFTYFDGYSNPSMALFDEHYYIVHAERYVHQIVFFDVNPPLGKMFIALGEKIFNINQDANIQKQLETGFIYLEDIENFSLEGLRFFPVLFGFFSGLLIFFILYGLSRNKFLSLMFSSLYLFENSSIVQFRTAMLDSTLIFFSFITILYFIYLYEKKNEKTLINYFMLGLFTGLATFTKMVGFVLVLLLFFLLLEEFKILEQGKLMGSLGKIFKRMAAYALAICIVCLTVYYTHVALGANVYEDVSEAVGINGMRVGSSPKYTQMIKNKDIYNPLKLFIPMRDYFNHIRKSQSLLPKLTNKASEIGSLPIGWPIGIKNINYAFDSDTESSNKWWYVNFQGNPVNWLLGLIAILVSVGLILAKTIFRFRPSSIRIYKYIFIFTSLYVGYMLAVILLGLQRVLYIHTYILPLFFSFILFFLVFNYIFEKYIIEKDKILKISIFLLVSQIVYVYFCISPVTYAKSITYLDCEKTRLVSFWEDDCIEH